MSFNQFLWREQLWDEELGLHSTTRLVGFALVTFADNKTGRAYPSYAGLAERCGLSRRVVVTHVAELVKVGLLRVESGVSGVGSNVYFLVSDAPICTSERGALVQESNRGGERGALGGVHMVHRGGERGAPELSNNYPINYPETVLPPADGEQGQPLFDVEPAQPAPKPAPPMTLVAEEPKTLTAHQIAVQEAESVLKPWWELQHPKPGSSFVAIRQRLVAWRKGGHDLDTLRAFLEHGGPFTDSAFDFWIAKLKQKRDERHSLTLDNSTAEERLDDAAQKAMAFASLVASVNQPNDFIEGEIS